MNPKTISQLLAPGTPAPDMTLTAQHGNPISLADYRGKKIILFFYPKDNTPTCTKEACNLRDNHTFWQERGYEVIGVSIDGEKSHRKFIDKYDLPFTLIADPDQKMVEAFGVWGEKKMYGRTYMGTHRVTFVLDEAGIVTHVVEKVKSANHTEQLREILGE